MGFNPGKSLGPGLIFSVGFIRVVDERTGFQIRGLDEIEDFLFMCEVELSVIISSEKIE